MKRWGIFLLLFSIPFLMAQTTADFDIVTRTTTLGAGASFTSRPIRCSDFPVIDITSFSDQAGTLNIQVSMDNATFRLDQALPAIAGAMLQVANRHCAGLFARINYVNGGVAQGTFQLSFRGRKP